MSDTIIKIENLSKQYRLGQVGTGTISHDINRWWARMRGKEDPFAKIGVENDRTRKGDDEYVWALRDLNFEVQRGDALGIIGQNGAGKSTLLKLLSQVTSPSSGSIKIKGRIASLLEVGTGFQPELTGRENVFLNGAILGMTKQEIKKKFDDIVEFAGIAKYIDTPVKRYSSGMYVRLAFAVAAYLESEILILDEVLAVGDAEFQNKCIGKMQDVSTNSGRTVLFVSHQMSNIIQLCNKAILMDKGSIRMQGSTADVVEGYLNKNNASAAYYKATDSSKTAYFQEIVPVDCDNNVVNQVLYNDGFRLKMRFVCRENDTLSKIGIALVDKYKRKIFTSHFDFKKGKNDIVEVICEVPGKIIMPGPYTLDAAIFIPNLATYEYLNDACKIDIFDNGSDLSYNQGDVGCVNVNCNWYQ